MRLRYWGTVDGADRWVDMWRQQDGLPRVVELRLNPVVRVRLGPGGTTDLTQLSPLMRPPIVVALAMGAW